MRTIENLVFKGGGVLGIAYAGAIEALEEHTLLSGVKRVAGTSSGSIMAALLSLRYTSKDITQIAHDIQFKKFGDHLNPLRIGTRYGLYKGDKFLTWMKGLIKDKTGNENITYSQLVNAGFRDLKVFATDLNTSNVREFSADLTPSVIVAESLRASMALPLFFSAWKFPNNNPDDHVYVDGGIVYNYPITAFGDLDKTLGFFLYNESSAATDFDFDELLKYIKLLYKALNTAQDIDFGRDKIEEAVTVKISDLGISSTDLELSDDDKKKLFDSGKQATLTYLAQHK